MEETDIINRGALIQIFIDEKRMIVPELAKRSGIASSTIYGHIDKNVELLLRHKICYAHGLNIHVSSFDHGKIIPLASKINKKELISYPLIHKNRGDYIDFIEEYFKAIIPEIKLANESILIVDYLKTGLNHSFSPVEETSSANSNLLKFYAEKYKEYLLEIEKVVEANNITKYERHYQCPLSICDIQIGAEAATNEAIDLIYCSTLEHVKRLKDKGCAVKIFLITKPIRTSSYIVIDKKTILTEYLYYTQKGESRMDMLYLEYSDDDQASFAQDLILSQQQRFFDAKSTDSFELTLEELLEKYVHLEAILNVELKTTRGNKKAEVRRKLNRTQEKIIVLKKK